MELDCIKFVDYARKSEIKIYVNSLKINKVYISFKKVWTF